MHQVDYDGLVALQVVGPGLEGHDLVRAAVGVHVLHVRLVEHAVEVLVQAVEDVDQDLAGVVLLIALELTLFWRMWLTIEFRRCTVFLNWVGANASLSSTQMLCSSFA